jgi:hypothetical protein
MAALAATGECGVALQKCLALLRAPAPAALSGEGGDSVGGADTRSEDSDVVDPGGALALAVQLKAAQRRTRAAWREVAERGGGAAGESRAQAKASALRCAALSAELGSANARAVSLESQLALAESRAGALERSLAESCAAQRSAEAKLSAHQSAHQSTPLSRSVPVERHDATVAALQAEVRASNERMVALDNKFKQLWQQMKDENAEIRAQAERTASELCTERDRRAREEARAKDALKRQRFLEDKVKALEQDANKLRQLVKSVKEQSQLMRTIARIRNETTAQDSAGVMGFDSLVRTIDSVHSEVERQCFLSGLQ